MKIYKKIFCLIVISIGLNTAALAAGGIPVTKPFFDRFYVGLGAGLVLPIAYKLSADNKIDVWSDDTKTTKLLEIDGNYDDSKYTGYKHGFGLPIFAGYGKTFNKFYLGGEIGASYLFDSKMSDSYDYSVSQSPTNPNATHDVSGQYEVKNPFSLNAALRFGYLLSQRTMIYALIGFDYSKFKVTNTMSDHYKDNDFDKNFTITDKFNKWFDPVPL